jgi:mannosyltransferase
VGDLAALATQFDAAPLLAPEPVTAPRADSPSLAPRAPAWLIPACSALITLAVTPWRIDVPSFWRDEGATLSAVHRTLPQLIRMLGQMDAVHGAYYLLMWLLVRPAADAARHAVPAHPLLAGERHLAVAVPPGAPARPGLTKGLVQRRGARR